MKENACLVFDIGRTESRTFLFNESYEAVEVNTVYFPEIFDEDRFRAGDISAIREWILEQFETYRQHPTYRLKAVNFVSYAGAMVHLNKDNEPLTPLYDVLKPVPYAIEKAFFASIGSKNAFELSTGSPYFGMLNAATQLFWLKTNYPEISAQIKNSLFLANYGCFLLSGQLATDRSSVECHAMLWDFKENNFHEWVTAEGFIDQLPAVVETATTYPSLKDQDIQIGVGIQAVTATNIPYLATQDDPFLLSSSRSWTVNSNPFAKGPVSQRTLENQVFSQHLPTRPWLHATRVHSVNEHARQTRHLANYFQKPADYFRSVAYNPQLIWQLRQRFPQSTPDSADTRLLFDCPFVERNLNQFKTYDEAYHQFMLDLVAQEVAAIRATLGIQPIRRVILEGSLTESEYYVQLLNEALFDKFIFVQPNGTGEPLGAAMLIGETFTAETQINLPLTRC